jgi:hypothetical protein
LEEEEEEGEERGGMQEDDNLTGGKVSMTLATASGEKLSRSKLKPTT